MEEKSFFHFLNISRHWHYNKFINIKTSLNFEFLNQNLALDIHIESLQYTDHLSLKLSKERARKINLIFKMIKELKNCPFQKNDLLK